MPSSERFWPSRLRWRLRGALQWPAFAVATALDALIIHWLPPFSSDLRPDSSLDIFPALLIAGFGNLLIVAAGAPLLARGLARRRLAGAPDVAPEAFAPDREALKDAAATALLLAGVVACLIAGFGNRPTIVQATDALAENGRQVRSYVIRSGDHELARNLETADTIRLRDGYFRTCISRDDRQHRVCIIVDTTKDPTKVDGDPSEEPNSTFQR